MPPGYLNRNNVLMQALALGQGSEAAGGGIVPLEPDFSRGSDSSGGSPVVDDGRIENRIFRFFGSGRPERTNISDTQTVADLPLSSRRSAVPQELCFFHVNLPSEFKSQPAQMEQLLGSLVNSLEFVAFEIIATGTELYFQFVSADREREVLARQLRAHLPEFDIRSSKDALAAIDRTRPDEPIIVQFDLRDNWFLPIPTGKEMGADPLIPLVGAIDDVGNGEIACVQFIFGRTGHPWQQSARADLFDAQGKAVYSNLADQLKGIRQKLVDPLAAVSVRLLINGADTAASTRLAREVMPYFKQFGSVEGNSLIPLRMADPAGTDTVENVVARTSHKSGFLLTLPELSSLVRFPSDAVRSVKLRRHTRREKRAPEATSNGSVVLGHNVYQNERREVKLSRDQLTRHMFVVGGSGGGKSTFLCGCLRQFAEQDVGFALIDPAGDLVSDVISLLPEKRLGDVILLDASDTEWPIGFNPLEARTESERYLLGSDLLSLLKRNSTSWGPTMEAAVSQAINAFLYNPRGGTLADLGRFLTERAFRSEVLKTVEDDSVRYFWEHESAGINAKSLGSVLIRLDSFLRHPVIRNMLCQRETKLDIRQLMDDGKILAFKVSQGLIGDANAALLASLLVSKIYQTALSRQDLEIVNRKSFIVVADEAQNYLTESLGLILAGTRKYGCGLALSTQSHRVLQNHDPQISESILANCLIRVCFRLSDDDAQRLARGFSSFSAEDLQNLDVGEAVCRIERADRDFNLRVEAVPRVDPDIAKSRMDAIREYSRKTYGRARSEVEAELRVMRTDAKSSEKKAAAEPKRKASPAEQSNDAPSIDENQKLPVQTEGATGNEHAYLQNLVKRIGEKRGYRATTELAVMGGVGRIDVALESEAYRIAVEIARTNTTDYELNNIQKCFAACFDRVVILSTDPAHLRRVRVVTEKALSPKYTARLVFVDPEQLDTFLTSLPMSESILGPKEEKIKGYKVTTVIRQPSEAEARAKQKLIDDILDKTHGKIIPSDYE